jgi:hypothetical protein
MPHYHFFRQFLTDNQPKYVVPILIGLIKVLKISSGAVGRLLWLTFYRIAALNKR